MYHILEKINSLADFKRLPKDDLIELARQIRAYLIDCISENGGHLASNLGIVEITMALHRVFDAPHDKIIFDVGHQAYVHKILTGRRAAFNTIRQENGISGFPKREESEYDAFNTGHAGTSVSAALGMLRAHALRGDSAHVVALVGDAAMSNGMIFEAMNDAGQKQLPLIIVLNDNDMSIAKNVGALNAYLTKIRSGTRYINFKRKLWNLLDTSKSGTRLAKWMERVKNRIKYMLISDVFFESMGFRYFGPIDGHDIKALCDVLEKAKYVQKPVLIHAVTHKGMGYSFAENDPEKFHGVAPFLVESGAELKSGRKSNSAVFGRTLCRLAEKNKSIVAITAAMPKGTGLEVFAYQYPERFFDVGIAEEHAITMAAGMAAAGLKPVVALYSTFLQRAYDQLLHDVCLQKLPVTVAVDRAGPVGDDGETHHGLYDIALLRNMPGMSIFSPSCRDELEGMLEMAVNLNGPCAVRYPRGAFINRSAAPLEFGKWEILIPSKSAVIIATGRMVDEALEAAKVLDIGVINARFISPLDTQVLDTIGVKHIFTLEDGIEQGGLGSAIVEYFACKADVNVHVMGFKNEPLIHATQDRLFERAGLYAAHIITRIRGEL